MKVMALDFGAGPAPGSPSPTRRGVIARPLCVVPARRERERARRARAARPRGGAGAGRRRPSADASRRKRGEQGHARRRNFAAALRERLDVPVSALRRSASRPDLARAGIRSSAPEDARGPPRTFLSSYLAWFERRPGVMPPKPGPPPRQGSAGVVSWARRFGRARAPWSLAGLIAFRALVKITRGKLVAVRRPPSTAIAAPKPFRIVFPEGFNRLEMARRVEVVAKIAPVENGTAGPSGLTKAGLPSQRPAPRVVSRFGHKKRDLEGFLFPATYDFLAPTTSRPACEGPAGCVSGRTGRHVDLSYAAERSNSRPYDVLDHRPRSSRRKRSLPDEASEDRTRHLQTACTRHMNLGIDATTRYGLHVPGTKVADASPSLASEQPLQTRGTRMSVGLPPTPIANPGTRGDGRQLPTPATGKLALLRSKARSGAPLLHRQLQRFRQPRASIRVLRRVWRNGARRAARPSGSRTRSRRGMQNAAFAGARALDFGVRGTWTCRRNGSRRR